ncbi:PREDICTED: red chlorophyll catabolite reductase, chloroplastic-like [Populus euphratica]|uniref:Red chlorophyll catabolite reductase, chloroplastic-like n=1 Tax=Populus euphratica TaxID=75702 RepID=A0AAJ6V9X7_POPEU|nr:PREDICTED: red chlorophyll catabolite reductase, chloroplastic-like [Populus euphratica]
MEFPHILAPHKDLMVGPISAVDKRLHGHLLPSSASVPPDAEYYQNQSGASQGSLCINRGVDSSPTSSSTQITSKLSMKILNSKHLGNNLTHYFSSSLYFQNVVSSMRILVGITCEDGGTTERAEEIIRDNIDPIANEVLELWMDSCVCKEGTTTVGDNERDQLEKRDRMIKSRAIEMDLSSSMPI